MLRSLSLYHRFLSIQIRSQMQYRTAFILQIIAEFIVMGLYFLSLALILQRFESVGGWRLGEVAFLYGMVEIGFGLSQIVFAGFAPRAFGRRVRLGALDQLLLRPVSPILQVFGSRVELETFGRVIQGAVIFGISLSLLTVEWTWLKFVYLPIVVLSMACFFGGLFIIAATITIWTVESIEIINILTYGGSEMIAYPMHIYPDWIRRFFTFIVPAIFLNYYPALFFLDLPDPFGFPAFVPFLTPLVSIGMLLTAGAFWQFGLTYYQSTGT